MSPRHRGHRGPRRTVRADQADVHDVDPRHGPGRVREGPASDVRAVQRQQWYAQAWWRSWPTAATRSSLPSATPRTFEKHVGNIFSKLCLAQSDADHRRVLAVLRYLES